MLGPPLPAEKKYYTVILRIFSQNTYAMCKDLNSPPTHVI